MFTESAETNGEPSGLDAYLETVSLLTKQDSEGKEERNRVTLMTMHSAKGLEFKHIYIVGLEENLFPSLMSKGNDRDIEEERRLFYVALTRAKDAATLSYAQNRYKWGKLEDCKPSMFLDDIDEKFLDYSLSAGALRVEKRDRAGRVNEKAPVIKRPERTNLTRVNRDRPVREDFSYTKDLSLIKPGVKVSHERFGDGEVITIEGEPPNTTAIVKFNSAGEKKLLLRFAKLILK